MLMLRLSVLLAYEVGEGIEVAEVDFAAEVAEQLKDSGQEFIIKS